MPGTNSLTITVSQREGDVLSTTTLDYPSLENATANVLQQDFVDAIQAVVDKWAEAKADLIGEREVYELAQNIRNGLSKAPPKK